MLDLIAPRTCVACDQRLDVLDIAPGAERGFCAACGPLLEPIQDGPAAYEYGGPLADAVQRFKYGGREDVGASLGRLVTPLASRHRGQVDAVVPVPLHPRRRARRGFNQAAQLAAPLASALGVPMKRRWMRRVRDTPAQAKLGFAARATNLDDAFAARGVAGARILLFDDVLTTGATLNAARATLERAGAARVRIACLAARMWDSAPAVSS